MCPREPLPLEGAAERSEAGLASFFAAEPPPFCLPHWGRGTAPAVDRVLSHIVDLRRISPLVFHTASTLSGSLRSPPSPRGEGCDTEIPLSPHLLLTANKKDFSLSLEMTIRRNALFSLLPEEGGSDRASPFPWKELPSAARRGWLSLLAAKPPPLCLPHRGRGTAPAVDRVLP